MDINKFLLKNNFEYIEDVYGGAKGCIIKRIVQDEKDAILKVGIDLISKNEVKENIQGYRKAESYPVLKNIFPEIYDFGEDYIIMEYLGNDFRNSNISIVESTEQINKTLSEIYSNFLINDKNQSITWLNSIKEHEKKYFSEYLLKFDLINEDDVNLVDKIDVRQFATNYISFSTSDFTPDNLFFSGGYIKYIDPKKEIIGVPIIDLAMLTTLYSIYNMPEADSFEEKIVGMIYDYDSFFDSKDMAKLIAFGRFRQYTLSARFRFERGNIESSKYCARCALSELERLIQ